jgi:manganese/zinc/iron transport system permease protein
MEWYSIDTWIVVIGALAAGACALLGNFLVLRKMSMMGDAISHAVLPGLAIAFLVTGARASLSMFIGAAIVGVLTAVFTQWISRFGKVDEGASMGIVFTTLFALGLLLIVQGADHVDLDPSCVLYGAIELTPLDVVWRPALFGSYLEVPRAALVLAGVCLFNAVFVVAFFKELRISSFDAELATAMGIHSKLMHYLLMTLVAVTTVACFEAVGSIIVIAMLIVPAATAHLLTDRLWLMVVLSVLIAIASAVLGHLSALIVPGWFGFADTSTSGMMAVMAGLIFSTVMLFAPKYGVLPRLVRKTEAVR